MLEKELGKLKKRQTDLTQQWESERGDMLRLQVGGACLGVSSVLFSWHVH